MLPLSCFPIPSWRCWDTIVAAGVNKSEPRRFTASLCYLMHLNSLFASQTEPVTNVLVLGFASKCTELLSTLKCKLWCVYVSERESERERPQAELTFNDSSLWGEEEEQHQSELPQHRRTRLLQLLMQTLVQWDGGRWEAGCPEPQVELMCESAGQRLKMRRKGS